MQSDHVIRYLNAVESAFRKLRSGYFERYEEEILTPERANIRIRVRFSHAYLNTPHFPGLNTHPNHKHTPENVVSSDRPSAMEVIEEVNKYLI